MDNYKYEPPQGTELTVVHDIYGESIHVYFPIGDKESPQALERAIRQAQLSGGRKGIAKTTRQKPREVVSDLNISSLIAVLPVGFSHGSAAILIWCSSM